MLTEAARDVRYQAVLFDLDGTLIDTAPEICEAINQTLAASIGGAVTQQQVRHWIGDGTFATLTKALAAVLRQDPNDSVVEQEALSMVPVFRECYARLCGSSSTLYDGVLATMRLLQKANIKAAVVTNKEREFTERILGSHGISSFFSAVFCGDSLPEKKPNPAPVYACLNALTTSSEGALFVGDSRTDVLTARNAGIAIWCVPYGYNQGRPISDEHPDRVLEDFSQIADLLQVRASTPH